MEFDLSSIGFMGSVGLIVALVQVAKSWITDARYYPVLSLAVGIILNVLIGIQLKVGLVPSIFMGAIAGLTACGAYSAYSEITSKDDSEGNGPAQ